MSGKKRLAGEVEVDFDKLGRIGSKVNDLLCRRSKGAVEAYAVLRFLCVYYEEDLGIAFAPEFEEELKRVVKKLIESKNEAAGSAEKAS
ncbi:MAG: hypothetical protein NWF04_04380 [Candidatus Bathyarchaeota archaeon]|nr:hypothetical protein [Candidatus Bathyarchaeota archaeon]